MLNRPARTFSSKPTSPDEQGLEKLRAKSEQFQLIGNVFYLLAPDGIARSKLAAAAEKLLGVPTTARNWRSVEQIAELVIQQS